MDLNLGGELGFAWNFARNRERVGLFVLFFLGAFAAAGVLLLLLFALFGGALASGAGGGFAALSRNPASAFALIGGAVLILSFIVLLFVLIGFWIWLSGGIMRNAAEAYRGRGASLRECLAFAKTRFWQMVIASILVIVVSAVVSLPFTLLSLIPLIGVVFVLLNFLVRFVVSLALFFTQYEVVVSGHGVIDSLRESANLFLKNALQMLILLIVFIVVVLVMFAALGFAAVLLILLAAGAYALLPGVAGLVVAGVVVLVAALVFLVGLSFFEIFTEGFLTAAFLDLGGELAAAPAAAVAPRSTARANASRLAGRKPALKPKRVSGRRRRAR